MVVVCLDCGAAFIQDLGGAGNDIRGENRFVIGEVAANSGTDFIYRLAAVIMADDGRCVGGISENESVGGIHFAASFHDSIYSEVVGGKRLADFFIGGEDGGVVADKIMQAGTQGTEDCVFIANGFNVFIREGCYDNFTVGNGMGNDAGGGEICDGFHNGEVTVAGCGFIIDAERGCFGVGEVIGRLNAQVYIVRGVLFDCGAALVKNVHCGIGKAFEVFDRLGFIFQPGVGTLAGLTGGGTGIEIADGGGQVKGIGEDEGIKRIHFRYFLSFHAVFLGRGFNRHQWPGCIHPTGQRR